MCIYTCICMYAINMQILIILTWKCSKCIRGLIWLSKPAPCSSFWLCLLLLQKTLKKLEYRKNGYKALGVCPGQEEVRTWGRGWEPDIGPEKGSDVNTSPSMPSPGAALYNHVLTSSTGRITNTGKETVRLRVLPDKQKQLSHLTDSKPHVTPTSGCFCWVHSRGWGRGSMWGKTEIKNFQTKDL